MLVKFCKHADKSRVLEPFMESDPATAHMFHAVVKYCLFDKTEVALLKVMRESLEREAAPFLQSQRL